MANPLATVLGACRGQLEALVLRAGVKLDQVEATPSWAVRAGTPLILLETEESDEITVPFSARTATYGGQDGVTVAHAWVRDATFGVFRFFHLHRKWPGQRCRELRLQLLRLHSEQEAIRLVLEGISRGQVVPRARSTASSLLQSFLRNAILRVLRRERTISGNNEDYLDTLDLARELIDSVAPGDTAGLLARLMNEIDVRPGVFRQVERVLRERPHDTSLFVEEVYLGNKVHVSGVTVASGGNFSVSGRDLEQQISDSFKNVAARGTPDVRRELQELRDVLASSMRLLSAELQEQVARDFKAFSEEATAKAPRAGLLSELGGALSRAFEGAGELAGRIGKIVAQVKSYLAP